MAIRIVSLDFDHTLSLGLSALEHYAARSGLSGFVADLETRFRCKGLSTDEFSRMSAHIFSGKSVETVHASMKDISLIADVAEVVTALRSCDIDVIINTVGYRVLIEPIARRLGILTVSGATLETIDGVMSGNLVAPFSEYDKVEFAGAYAQTQGYSLENVAAVGDSWSDIPLFEQAGMSIALNADHRARAAAKVSVESKSLRAIMEHLPCSSAY